MPFRSEAQRRFMYAQHPEIAARWEDSYGTPKDLPFHKGDSLKVRAKKRTKVKRGKASYADRRKAAELKRDPGDLVLSGKGSAAQERRRDPGELYSRAGGKSKKRPNSKARFQKLGR